MNEIQRTIDRLEFENKVLRTRRDIIDHGTLAKQLATSRVLFNRALWLSIIAVIVLAANLALAIARLYPLGCS